MKSDGGTANHKRGQRVVSRRGPASQAPEKEVQHVPGALGSDLSSLAGPPSGPFRLAFLGKKRDHTGPPLSGNFVLPFTTPSQLLQPHPKKGDKDEHKDRSYKVQVPVYMLCILGLVFLVVPLLIFFYKEIHIHDVEKAHYKKEKFINLNTQDVMSEFSHQTRPNATAGSSATTTTTALPPDSQDPSEKKDLPADQKVTPLSSKANANATKPEASIRKDAGIPKTVLEEASERATERKASSLLTTNKDEGEPMEKPTKNSKRLV